MASLVEHELDDFDFVLPEELIALEPAAVRDRSRLLHVAGAGDFREGCFANLADFFEAGDVVVLNDSRVLPAALSGVRQRGAGQARVHCNLHKRLSAHEWLAFAKPFKRLDVGDVLSFGGSGAVCTMGALTGRIAEKRSGGEVLIAFDCSGAPLDEQLALVGDMPLPPYIAGRRPANDQDRISYQTVYADVEGSVAAPTAGLHFTEGLLEVLDAKGVIIKKVTLHVGAGTFLPVKSERISEHKMHSEWGVVSADCVAAIKQARADGRRVTAVGTTSLRLLESAARESGELQPFEGDTDIFITPGFQFRVVDRMITNFHLPKSTLFMLVSAFAGLSTMQAAYAHAISAGFRFYSYGDACFLERLEG